MHYYWPGLDYLKWIMGVIAAGCFLMMLPEPASTKRGFLKLAACCIAASAIFCGALAGVLFNKRAPHRSVEGVLRGVKVWDGKGSHTDFRLDQVGGETLALSIDRAVSWIHDGDFVNVVYQAGSGAVLSITMLAGPSTGWRSTGGNDGEFGAWMALVAAVALAGYGVLDWISDGRAIPNEAPQSVPAPDGDVDSASMLNLSGRDT